MSWKRMQHQQMWRVTHVKNVAILQETATKRNLLSRDRSGAAILGVQSTVMRHAEENPRTKTNQNKLHTGSCGRLWSHIPHQNWNEQIYKIWWDFQPQITLHRVSRWYKDEQCGVEMSQCRGPPTGSWGKACQDHTDEGPLHTVIPTEHYLHTSCQKGKSQGGFPRGKGASLIFLNYTVTNRLCLAGNAK